MPVLDLRCPACGAEVTVGLPRGATVKSVTEEGVGSAVMTHKVRKLACENGHQFHVAFTP